MSSQGYPIPDLEARLDSLVTSAYRRENFTQEEYEAQELATLALIDAASRRLTAHQIDRDTETNMHPEHRRYDAFFGLDDKTVIVINSVGKPETPATCRLFVYIYNRTIVNAPEGQVVGLQTAKSVTVIDDSNVKWLSGYTPEQIRTIVDLIDLAEPITKDEFNKRFGRDLY